MEADSNKEESATTEAHGESINSAGIGFQEPFKSLASAFPICHFHSAYLRISHFIPLQKSLQGTTSVDVTSFNVAPYITPIYSNNSHRYLPFDLFKSGLLGPEISPAKAWVQSYNRVSTPEGGALWIADTNGQMCSPDITANPIFLFLPFIEPVSTSENATRMMAHVLLQTSIDFTVYSPTDGFTEYYKQDGQTEPADPLNVFMQQQTLVPEFLDVASSNLHFSNFVQKKFHITG
ncbi:unnamed protein product [Schistosoma margrebowiei]|uniref:Uncharacterized protein n=1 Tax=Schistosoma margrebowiei TaxID=48269 RepID=A0A183MF06_9TREM|nr:unnamed protein product [Schistosoma margrebowiei]